MKYLIACLLFACTKDPVPPPFIVADGNSLVWGSCASDHEKTTYPADLAAYGYRVRNAGAGSQTTEGLIVTAPANVDSFFEPRGIDVVWEGRNSWRVLRDSPSRAYDAMSTYVKDRQRVGWRVVILTTIAGDEDGGPSGWTEFQNEYNFGLLTNRIGAEGIVDVGSDPRLSDAHSSYFCSDHLHLSDSGYAVVAELVKQGIEEVTHAAHRGI